MNLSSCSAASSLLVGCNVYVSAGRLAEHVPLLLHLLKRSQEECRFLSSSSSSSSSVCATTTTTTTTTTNSSNKRGDNEVEEELLVGVVHAYSDPIYNRSSFHLAGTMGGVAHVASWIATRAMQQLTALAAEEDRRHHRFVTAARSTATNVDHPFVGYVDHISVMPLEGIDSFQKQNQQQQADEEFVPSTASGKVARYIGNEMKQQQPNCQVYYYGSAHPQGKSLATIRRERTSFFQSGGLSKKKQQQHSSSPTATTTTTTTTAPNIVTVVGAPLEFVENYNIRLRNTCTKAMAQSLTRYVRERDGGLKGVEALTLPYDGGVDGQWEVACNLLHPSITTADDVERHARAWDAAAAAAATAHSTGMMILRGYRVGTTVSQCLNMIRAFRRRDPVNNNNDGSSSGDARTFHDTQVMEQFQKYLSVVNNNMG